MSSKRPDSWMPLYIGDYLRDTSRLTTEQHGAYLLLIMDYFVNGPLPDDDAALASITRTTAMVWKRMRPVLAGYFGIDGGKWVHSRIERERDKSASMTKQRIAAGHRSATKRWGRKDNENVTTDITDPVTGEVTSVTTDPSIPLQRNHTQPQPQKDSFQGRGFSQDRTSGSAADPAAHPGMRRVIDGGKRDG